MFRYFNIRNCKITAYSHSTFSPFKILSSTLLPIESWSLQLSVEINGWERGFSSALSDPNSCRSPARENGEGKLWRKPWALSFQNHTKVFRFPFKFAFLETRHRVELFRNKLQKSSNYQRFLRISTTVFFINK